MLYPHTYSTIYSVWWRNITTGAEKEGDKVTQQCCSQHVWKSFKLLLKQPEQWNGSGIRDEGWGLTLWDWKMPCCLCGEQKPTKQSLKDLEGFQLLIFCVCGLHQSWSAWYSFSKPYWSRCSSLNPKLFSPLRKKLNIQHVFILISILRIFSVPLYVRASLTLTQGSQRFN